MSAATLELWVAAAVLGIFALTFLFAWRTDNYSVVDVAWSYSVGLGALFYAVAGTGWGLRRLALGVVMGGWSLRLGTHIWRRLARSRHEDPRYREMRTRWPSFFKTRMAAVFLFQAALVWGLDWPVLLAAQNLQPRWQGVEWLGFALSLGSIAGEALADRQLAAFRGEARNQGRVCAAGLWRYSRHPNYFFEWLFWVGVALIAWPAPGGGCGLIAPAAMLIFLTGLTGIPPAERQSLRSKGEHYRAYQRTTSAFVPWPPRGA